MRAPSVCCSGYRINSFDHEQSESAAHQPEGDDDGQDDDQDHEHDEQVVGDGHSVVLVVGRLDGLDVSGLLDSGKLVDELDVVLSLGRGS